VSQNQQHQKEKKKVKQKYFFRPSVLKKKGLAF